jgi:hypothetical protein
VFWLLAMVLFCLPSAVVVIYLNRLMPLEGGLYQWAKLGFNELTGFLVAWNLWLFAILNTSENGFAGDAVPRLHRRTACRAAGGEQTLDCAGERRHLRRARVAGDSQSRRRRHLPKVT